MAFGFPVRFSATRTFNTTEEEFFTAVKMLNQPPFFDSFAASIRHRKIDDADSEVIYKVNFTAKPVWLRPFLNPVMRAVFVWETRKRLKALKDFFEVKIN